MELLGKMGAAPATETCSCAASPSTISDDKLRQLELRLLAKLEEAVNKPPPPASFFLQTEVGVFIWSGISNMVSGLLLLWFVNLCCKLGDVFGFSRAVLDICNYMSRRGLQAGADPNVDIGEGAMALASPGVTVATAADIKAREEEMIPRKEVRIWLKGLSGKRKMGDDTLPVTNCEALSAASQASAGSILNRCPTPSMPLPDTINVPVPVGLLLPNTTGVTAEDLQAQAVKYLPSHTQDYSVESGSTFLSATVWIAASAMDDLLHRAVCLLKMGCDLDAACTVQLGNTAILCKTTTETGENVKRKLLKEGVHDVPIITSAQKFQDRTIVIKGSYLEDSDIKATTSIYGESTHLHVLYHQKLENGVEVLLAQLPKDKPLHGKTMVHATKTIQLEGCSHPLVLRGKGKEIDTYKQNSSIFGTLRTTRFWICFLVLCIYQVTRLGPQQWLLMEGIFRLIIFLLNYFLVEYIIGPWTFGMITHWIEIKMQRKNLYHILAPRNLNCPSPSRASLEMDKNNATNRRPQDEWSDEESDIFSTIFHAIRHRHGDLSDDNDVSTFSTSIETDVQRGPVNSLSWEWPCYERFQRKGRWVIEPATAKASEKEETAKWPFEVMTTVHHDGSEAVQLIVRSRLLIQVLKQCEPKTDTQFVEGSRIQPKEIFLRREGLKSYVARESDHIDAPAAASGDHINEAQISVWYVRHLLRFIERNFADALVQYERMKTEGCVSFEMLWAFFVPGEGVCRRCLVTNQECFAIVKRPATYKTNHQGDTFCCLTLNVMDFNVQSYHRCTMEYKIAPFDGEVPFTSLQVCPLQFFSNRIKEMEARFISMGNIFYRVAMQQRFRFLQFKGSMNFYQSDGGCLRVRKLNSDGRVMIDLLSFARMNPDYPFQNAEPPCEVMIGMWTPEEQMKKPTDEELMLAPAFAYGFSFRLKKWGCFELCGLGEISFNQGAFDALKMKIESQKMILWSVVQQYIVNRGGSRVQNDQSIDPIATKGTGCIVLCHGPPGTGKTLTAEALAETLQCPLWSISAFELGDKPDRVEATLSQIMEIAYNWGAILLLDEADTYLERRDEGVDVTRNLLTGVFLRVLEYYRGIMFLTTNRVTAFDDAILSRTTLAINYPALDDTQRREIWKKLLNRVGIHDATYDALLHHDLNGRQIRNTVHLAQLLAHGRKQALHITHVIDAMDAFIAGTEDLPQPMHLLPAASS